VYFRIVRSLITFNPHLNIYYVYCDLPVAAKFVTRKMRRRTELHRIGMYNILFINNIGKWHNARATIRRYVLLLYNNKPKLDDL